MDFQNFTHKKTLYNQQQVIACIGQYLNRCQILFQPKKESYGKISIPIKNKGLASGLISQSFINI